MHRRLLDFHKLHKTRRLTIANNEWEYIVAGKGATAVLLLPGGTSTAESTFPLIQSLEQDYTIIAPSYNLSVNMTGLCKGVAEILAKENIENVHVVGSSYGGLVAQYFIRQYPGKVKSLVLAHTFIVKQGLRGRLKLASRLQSVMPKSLMRSLLMLRIKKLVLNQLEGVNHPEKDFWRSYYRELIRSGLFNKILTHQNKSLIECTGFTPFHPGDLDPWKIKVLIIESDNDAAISKKNRAALKAMYPSAEVFSFKDAGHMSFITEGDALVKVIVQFWNRISS